ncbi:hypothetical protein KP509_29G051300 [Ceratopteris richardii]|nr:hypothetical protein KP509_29G051300 [Ceratopteris richardii]
MDVRSNMSFQRTPSPSANETLLEANNSADQFSKVSFDVARSSLLTPRRLDSSRSLHEVRINATPDTKVFARRSVDTAERAAAAARGALRELSRISRDFVGIVDDDDQISIRDIVRCSLNQEQHVSKSAASLLHPSPRPPRPSIEAQNSTRTVAFSRDKPKTQNMESRTAPQTDEPFDAFRHSKHSDIKPSPETPSKTCSEISESLRLLAKLRESASSYNTLIRSEGAEYMYENNNPVVASSGPQPPVKPSVDALREGPGFYGSRSSLPRVPLDRIPGRTSSYEPPRQSFMDSILQGTPKARDIPRLSLDGRGSAGRVKPDSQSKLVSRALVNSRSVSCSNSDCDAESIHEKRSSFSSNVVAKLMGLDEIPGDDHVQLRSRAALSGCSDQKTTLNDNNPTFSQCGKFVSASFFPSKRRDDVKLPIELEYEDFEDDGYLQFEPQRQREASALNVNVGGFRGQMVAKDNPSHLGSPCYQPRNHHLLEDRPPHVLSPAARICAQIEEMQRADGFNRDVDKGSRGMGLHQSMKLDVDALSAFFGTANLCHGASYLEKFSVRETQNVPQHEGGRVAFRQAQPSEQHSWSITSKARRMISDESNARIQAQHGQNIRSSSDYRGRSTRSSGYEEAPHQSNTRHYSTPDSCHQVSRIRTDAHVSPRSAGSSMCSTPRRTPGNGYIPSGGNNVQPAQLPGGRRMAEAHTPPNGASARFLTSPRTPAIQHMRSSSNGSCSWEASSVSSSASSNTKDQYTTGNVGYRPMNRQRGQNVERVDGSKKISFLKNKEESKTSHISQSPNLPKATERKRKSGRVPAASRSNSCSLQRPLQVGKLEDEKASSRSHVSPSTKKTMEVKRRLSFSSRVQDGASPSETCDDDHNVHFVDKAVVSSVERKRDGSGVICNLGEEVGDQMRQNPLKPTGLQPDAGVNLPDRHDIESSIFDMNAGDSSSFIGTQTGSLRLPQAIQEVEDTESQGGKSIESFEQPSPISVLEGPFYEDDGPSPPISTSKFVLKLKELREEMDQADGRSSLQEEQSLLNSIVGRQDSSLTDYEYVKHLLEHSCLVKCQTGSVGAWKLRPLDSSYLIQPEKSIASNPMDEADSKSRLGNIIWRRKMLLDGVNMCLERRLQAWRLCQYQPWILACDSTLIDTIAAGCSWSLRQGIVGLDEQYHMCLSDEGVKVLLEEVWCELEQNGSEQHGMSSNKSYAQQGFIGGIDDDEDRSACDDVNRLLEEDILGRPQQTSGLDTWKTLLMEKGELGLDLERLIFKDLIDDTIRDFGFLLHVPLCTTKRQLFKHHT